MGGYDPSEWKVQVHLKQMFPDAIETCFGLHPWYVKSDIFEEQRDLKVFQDYTKNTQFVGELGLDFFDRGDELYKERQLNIFEKQLELSKGKSFVFHVVQAHGQALEILKGHSLKGFIHSFTGSKEVALQYYKQGILLSFGPSLLKPNYLKAREALEALPLESLLVESDTPSRPKDLMDPVMALEEVYAEIAKIKNISVEELKKVVSSNLKSLL